VTPLRKDDPLAKAIEASLAIAARERELKARIRAALEQGDQAEVVRLARELVMDPDRPTRATSR
jgi:hypothetical protein